MAMFMDNERVAFLLRRFTERAVVDFRTFLATTVREHGNNWQQHWELTLPVIQTWSSANMEKVATEFIRDVPGATDLIEFVYLRYVTLAYGKDACGRKNKLEVEMVTFNQLYLAFLSRLARSPEVIRGTWFHNQADRDVACERALKDALHDVAEVRVRVLGSTECAPAPPKPSLPAPRRASTVMGTSMASASTRSSVSVPSRARSVVKPKSSLPTPSPMAVTPDDSASQINSLGVRHQKTQQSFRTKMSTLSPIPSSSREEPAIRMPAPPRMISFKAKDSKETKSQVSRRPRSPSSSSSSSSSSVSMSAGNRRQASGSTKLTLS